MGSKDKKALIALAAGTLALGAQGLHADTITNLGSGSDVRARLSAEAEINVDEVLTACPGGRCPRPKRPGDQGDGSSYRFHSATAKAQEGSCGEGSCGGGNGNGDGTNGTNGNGSTNGNGNGNGSQDEDKTSAGSCGKGTCG